MAELTIRLRRDPQTGKQDIVISLRSDEDALPHEHEQMHRQLVEKIIGKENVGKVIVEREPGPEPTSPSASKRQPNRRSRDRKDDFGDIVCSRIRENSGFPPPQVSRILTNSATRNDE